MACNDIVQHIAAQFDNISEIFKKRHYDTIPLSTAECSKIFLMMVKEADAFFGENKYSVSELFSLIHAWFGIGITCDNLVKFWWISRIDNDICIYRIITLNGNLCTFLTREHTILQYNLVCSKCTTLNYVSRLWCNCGEFLGCIEIIYRTVKIYEVPISS